jgi:hypothetical protein
MQARECEQITEQSSLQQGAGTSSLRKLNNRTQSCFKQFKTLENFTCSLPSIKISTLQKIIDALHKVVMQGSDLWVIRPIIHELKGRLQ